MDNCFKEDSTGDGNSRSIILYIAIGATVAILAIVLITYYCKKSKNSNNQED